MNIYWTHKKNICGLKHFVLVNQFEIRNELYVLLVSVLDSNVNLKIPKIELENSGEWIIGWQQFNKSESITSDYNNYLKANLHKINDEIYLEEGSPFNIS
tara:strand:+ start:26615 stop:26914 length:300 start_codon:yes stop_codon:yes gene_type:complete